MVEYKVVRQTSWHLTTAKRINWHAVAYFCCIHKEYLNISKNFLNSLWFFLYAIRIKVIKYILSTATEALLVFNIRQRASFIFVRIVIIKYNFAWVVYRQWQRQRLFDISLNKPKLITNQNQQRTNELIFTRISSKNLQLYPFIFSIIVFSYFHLWIIIIILLIILNN